MYDTCTTRSFHTPPNTRRYLFGGEFTSRSQTQFYHYRHGNPLAACSAAPLLRRFTRPLRRDMWRLDLQTYAWEQVHSPASDIALGCTRRLRL